MNFKTTLILLVILAGLGAYIYFAKPGGESGPKTEVTKTENERKLFDVQSTDISKITVAPADGKRMVLEKSGGNWKLTEPVAAPAETFEVDSLARALAELKSHGTVNASAGDAKATGLDNPRYKVEFTAASKNYALSVGDKSAVGDNLYVTQTDASHADVVGADLLEKLDKPASSYRDPKLVSLTTADVKKLSIKRGEETLEFVKSDANWKMTQPKQMPAETSEVDDVIFAVTGLRAAEWVAEDQKNAKQYQIDNPRFAVTLSPTTQPVSASTQPAATLPAGLAAATQPVTIRIGRYDDVLKKNVIIASSARSAVAKAPASIVDTLSKKPLEFRDKRAVTIDAQQVSEISIVGDIAATTQPTTKPATKKELVIRRHHEALPVGIAAPTSELTTKPATQASSKPSTQPTTVAATQPAIKWEMVAGADKKPADESKVDDLLAQLNPLRAEKYVESAPTTRPAATWTVKVSTQGPGGSPVNQYAITITDPGSGKTPVATYNDLAFEVSRTLVEKLEGDFKPSPPGAPKSLPNETSPEIPR